MGRKSKFDSSFKSKIAIEAVKEQRVKLVDKRPDGLSKSRCCKMLEVSRGSQYYKPKGESQANIDIMNYNRSLNIINDS